MKEYLAEANRVLDEQGSTTAGITEEEAARRLQEHGYNKLKEEEKDSLLKRFFGQMTDPMILILLAAALISGITSFYSGESFSDVIIILFVVIVNAVLGVVQESKAEAAIEALQEITAATSRVLRGGEMKIIRSEELVPGDVVVLEAGDAVPADGRIIEAVSMKVEEAALTGESVPVSKLVDALMLREQKDIPLGDRVNMVYMGSTVVYGRGKAVITATGMDTEVGKIADALSSVVKEQTPLQRKMAQLSKILSLMVIGICGIIMAVGLFRMYPDLTGTGILDTFMIAVSLAVAAIPEGLAAVVTIVLSIGVTNMSRRNAVIRKLSAVETLGCTQTICSDKTGTLTQNRMTVVEHAGDDDQRLSLAMSLCSDARRNEQGEAMGEPTECALVNDAVATGVFGEEESFTRIGEAPFDSSRKMMTVVCRGPEDELIQFTKGAPDEVLKRCTRYWNGKEEKPLTEEVRERILKDNKGMANQALRVLGCAQREWEDRPGSWEPEYLEEDLCFLGLSGMIDPIRPEVKAAVEECRGAGIRTVMITGDHPDTAAAIARQLGILEAEKNAITGAQLEEMSDEELREHIEEYPVFARVQPEHKTRIVKAWKSQGQITAMTGDGVNDAPSIKNANIGVGMGITGTDVTKNVADMVLADDNFATIVHAVEEGRRVYDNIRKTIQYLLSTNLAEVIAVFVATLLGFTILRPAHLLWLNLITDCFPALALGLERSEADIMKRPPRRSEDGIFAGGMGADIFIQGTAISILTLASYFIGHFMETGVWEIAESPDGITMAFLTMSLIEMFHAFNMRSQRNSVFRSGKSNKWLWGSLILSLVLTITVIYIPFLADAFAFQEISLVEFTVAVLLAVAVIPIVEVIKFVQRKRQKSC